MNTKGFFNYVIIDSALADTQVTVAQKFGTANVSLYKDTPDERADAVAPYLFSITNENKDFLKWIQENGWEKNWSIFISANISLQELAKHLRKFLIVRTEAGKEKYFRYYDPRVLRIFLPTCDKQQLKEFFGPITSFLAKDEDAGFTLIYKLEDSLLKRSRITTGEVFGDEKKVSFSQPVHPVVEKKKKHTSFIITNKTGNNDKP